MITALLLSFLIQDPSGLVEEVSKKRLRTKLEKLVSFGTRESFSETESEERGIGAARRWLKKEFEAIAGDAKSKMIVDFHTFKMRSRFTGEVKDNKNVFAMLRGTKRPKEVLVFGGHYDTINMVARKSEADAPGANDNGTGTIAVLEACRIMSQHEWDRTVVFVAFSGEEHGLWGARAFAKFLEESEFKVVGMINNDIVGGVQDADGGKNDRTIRCFSDPRHAPSRQMARYAKYVGERAVKDFEVVIQKTKDRPGRGGDHQRFSERGMPAIRIIETHENLRHQHNDDDLVKYISFDYFRRAVQLDLSILISLANAPSTPTGVKVSGEGVSWDPVEGADGYVVSVRKGGLAFTRVERARTNGIKLEIEEGATYSVAAVKGKSISLFTLEVSAQGD